MIRHVGDKWILYSSDGKKKLGTHDTEAEAQAQERAIYANKLKKLLKQLQSGIKSLAKHLKA